MKEMYQKNSVAITFFSVIVLCVFALLPNVVQAAVFRSGEQILVAPEQTVPGDFYAVGNDVYVSGTVEGDVVVAGGTVTLKGVVKGDVMVLGGVVSVDGVVDGTVRVIGGKVTVSQKVGHDVVVAAKSLAIVPSAHVFGSVYAYSEDVTVGGPVEGSITANTHTLTVNAKATSIDATVTGVFSIGTQAQIKKDIVYQSATEAARAPESVVEGSLHRQELQKVVTKNPSRGAVLIAFMSLFSSLVMVLMFRDALGVMFESRSKSLGVCAVVGVGVAVATPIAASMLCLTLVGIPFGIAVFSGYVVGCILSLVISSVFVGAYLAKLSGNGYRIAWLWTVLGVALLNALLLIPFVGVLVVIAVSVMVFGMMTLHIFHILRVGH